MPVSVGYGGAPGLCPPGMPKASARPSLSLFYAGSNPAGPQGLPGGLDYAVNLRKPTKRGPAGSPRTVRRVKDGPVGKRIPAHPSPRPGSMLRRRGGTPQSPRRRPSPESVPGNRLQEGECE